MDLDLSPDQRELQAAIARVVAPYATAPAGDTSHHLDGMPLYAELDEAGFLRAATMDEYGALGGVLLLEASSGLPYSVGAAGAALVAPLVTEEELPGPVAIAFANRGDVVRHLPVARTLLVVGENEVRALDLAGAQVRTLKSIFADPFGSVSQHEMGKGRVLEGVSPADVLKWWSIAVATEIGGAAEAALARTVEYVKIRRQFGKPIGGYQAIQHRLAECQVLVSATRMLARHAAVTGDAASAMLAATYAEAAAGRVTYDTQQFHGASGLTREIELHFFTYRLRSLQGELAALGGSAVRGADLMWPRHKAGTPFEKTEKRLPA
jgi:alkylation response protein AidB-like acyl-CoA dehydrogenase